MAQRTKRIAAAVKQRRDHDNTTISRSNRKLENALAAKLNAITNIIRRENPKNQIDIIVAKQRHFDRVYATIRKYTQQSYELGSKYVSNVGNFQPFLTTNDLNVIKSLARDFTDRFFGRISKAFEITRTIDNNVVVDPLSKYSNNFIVNSLAVAITSKALNLATIRKAQVMLPQAISQVINQQQQQQEAIKQGAVFDTLNNIFNPIQIWLTFTTSRDDRVCPVCMSLEGSQYLVDDPDKPEIPEHFNCRCRYLLSQETNLAKFLALGFPYAQTAHLLLEEQQQELEAELGL